MKDYGLPSLFPKRQGLGRSCALASTPSGEDPYFNCSIGSLTANRSRGYHHLIYNGADP